MNINRQSQIKEKSTLVYNSIKEIVDKVGPRLPTSKEEELGAQMYADQISEQLGTTPIIEKFKCAPRASIAFIPVLGILGLFSFIIFYLSPIASLILSVFCFIYAILQIFLYTGCLDFLFKKHESQNVYTILEPKSEKTNFTIMLSAHLDSSWCWQLSLKNPKTMMIKTIIGVISIGAIAITSLVAICHGAYSYKFLNQIYTLDSSLNIKYLIMYLIPFICVPGCYWLATYLTWDKQSASPGAMDNLTGCEIALATLKYYQENPEELPENCRLIAVGLGCEEAGLKGSEAFCKAHKSDSEFFNEHLYNINLDSFRDDEHFNVVKGDTWLRSHFDKKLIDLSQEAMKEAGLEPGIIKNPVGGCDSTPICRAGIKTVTLCAQNPIPTNYYHTTNDTIEGLSMYSIEKAFETILNLVPKIADYDKEIK